MGTQKTIKGVFNWAFLIVVIIGVILVNIISSFVYTRIDMTQDQRYSLNEGTIAFLENDSIIQSKMTIKIYLEGSLPSELKHFRDAIEDKLKEFRNYAGNKIEYEFIDPSEGTEAEREELYRLLYNEGKGILPLDLVYQKDGQNSQMLLWPGAVITYKGANVNVVQFLPGTPAGKPNRLETIGPAIQNSINNLEYILVSSIRRSVQQTRQNIGFLQGHGELTMPQTMRARALISPYFNVSDVTINEQITALDNYDGLVIANPKKKFSERDLFVIDQFVMNGGRLMAFVETLDVNEDSLKAKGMTHAYRTNIGIDKMLFEYGIKVEENFVIDAHCVQRLVPFAKQSFLPWYFHVLATPTLHPIAKNVEPVSLNYVNELTFVESRKNEYKMSAILTSSTNSAPFATPLVSLGMPLNFGPNPDLVDDPKSEANKRNLAVLVEGKFESAYKNRVIDDYAMNKDARFAKQGDKEAKIFVVGNGSFIQNRYDSMPNKMTGEMQYRPIQEINELRMDYDLAKVGMAMYYGNSEFFQNMVDYMMGDQSLVDLRSRQIDIHEIDPAKIQNDASFYKVFNMLLPSALVVVLAIVIAYLRRRKYILK